MRKQETTRMKIFVSWSGPGSRHIAMALRSWLPDVIQDVDPWVSATDIGAGARWGLEIGEQLDMADFGIICLTKQNLAAPWIFFEAGALSKRLGCARVVPYLIGIEDSDIRNGPLDQFQGVRADKDGTLCLVEGINSQLGARELPAERVRRGFERVWPELESRIAAMPLVGSEPALPDQNALMRDVLETVRTIARNTSPEAAQRSRIGYNISDVVPLLHKYVADDPYYAKRGAIIGLMNIYNDHDLGIVTYSYKGRDLSTEFPFSKTRGDRDYIARVLALDIRRRIEERLRMDDLFVPPAPSRQSNNEA